MTQDALPGMGRKRLLHQEVERVAGKPMEARAPEEMLWLATHQSAPAPFRPLPRHQVFAHSMAGEWGDNETPHLPPVGKGYEDRRGVHLGTVQAAVDRGAHRVFYNERSYLHLGEVQGPERESDDIGGGWKTSNAVTRYTNSMEDKGSTSVFVPRRLSAAQFGKGQAGVRFYEDAVRDAVKKKDPNVNPKAAAIVRSGGALHLEMGKDGPGVPVQTSVTGTRRKLLPPVYLQPHAPSRPSAKKSVEPEEML